MNEIKKVVLHNGVYKKPVNTSSAVFIITGMTIGAGILGIPYVVAQVGYWIGLVYIAVLGAVMLFLNLMIGEIVVRTKERHQLPGLAGRYLGNFAKDAMSLITIFGGLGAMLAYLVGEGEVLKTLFGSSADWWAVFFWTIASLVVWRGLQTVKVFEKILSLAVIGIITGLSLALLPAIHVVNLTVFNPAKIFLPFGVILFALHSSPAIAEAHALLPGSQKRFKRALIIGTLIPIFVYILFAATVVGVSGRDVTEIATIGLGDKFGSAVLLMSNLFAVLAMGTGFVGIGISMKQSLIWDHKVSPFLATMLVLSAPLTLYMAGLRGFINVMSTVGGLFMGLEAILIVLIYWRAKQKSDLPGKNYNLHHIWLLIIPVILTFTAITILSIIKIINF